MVSFIRSSSTDQTRPSQNAKHKTDLRFRFGQEAIWQPWRRVSFSSFFFDLGNVAKLFHRVVKSGIFLFWGRVSWKAKNKK